jgi:hypothetical protein
MTPRLMAAALQLAERGWFVFPLRPRDKRPLPYFKCWEQRATRDVDTIYRWWREAPYNIGIATGPSKLLVIDCDTADGATDWQTVGDDDAILGRQLPQTFRVRTPSGGLHLYFRAPGHARLTNTAGRLGRHIDTRGAGGYVVGPGSACPAGYYTITRNAHVAPLSSWIIHALNPAASIVSTARLSVSSSVSGPKYLQAILKGEADRVREARPGSETVTRFSAPTGGRVGRKQGARPARLRLRATRDRHESRRPRAGGAVVRRRRPLHPGAAGRRNASSPSTAPTSGLARAGERP